MTRAPRQRGATDEGSKPSRSRGPNAGTLTVVLVSADAQAEAMRLAGGDPSKVLGSLRAAAAAVAARSAAAASWDLVVRAERLAAGLAGSDPDADAALLDRGAELSAALALSPDADRAVEHVERLSAQHESTTDARRRAEAKARVAVAELGNLAPALRADVPVDDVRALARELAESSEPLGAATEELSEITRQLREIEDHDAAIGAYEVEAGDAKAQQVDTEQQAARLAWAAIAELAVGVPVAVLGFVGELPLGVTVSLVGATLLPAGSLLRRRSAIRAAMDVRVTASESRVLLAEHGLARSSELLRARHRAVELRLAAAYRHAAAARARWEALVGPDLDPAQAEAIADGLEVAAERRHRLRQLEQEIAAMEADFRRTVEEVGVSPEGTVQQVAASLRHLVSVRPGAEALIGDLAAAERRLTERQVLAALLAGRELSDLRAGATDPAADDSTIVVVDDGDRTARSELLEALKAAPRNVTVTVVSGEGNSDWRAKPTGRPRVLKEASQLDDSEARAAVPEDRPWFMSQ